MVRWGCTQRQVLPVTACRCLPVALWGVWVDWGNWAEGLVLRVGKNPGVGLCGMGRGSRQAKGEGWVFGKQASVTGVCVHACWGRGGGVCLCVSESGT